MKTIVLCFIDDYIVLKEYLHLYFDIDIDKIFFL